MRNRAAKDPADMSIYPIANSLELPLFIRNLVFVLALFLALICWSADLQAADKGVESQKAGVLQGAESYEPDLSKIIPMAADLSVRLVSLESQMEDDLDSEPITKEFSAIETRSLAAIKQLQLLKDEQESNYLRYLELNQLLANEKELLDKIGKPVAEAIVRLDRWGREWLVESQRWQAWQASLLRERSPYQLRTAFKTAATTIEKAQTVVLQHIEPLMVIQARGAAILSKISVFNVEVDKLIAGTRQDSLYGKSPPMYSPLYLSQFKTEMWGSVWGGLKLLAMPDSRFFARHGFAIGLLLLLFTILSVVINRNRQLLRESALWSDLAKRPCSTVLFICTLIIAFQLELWEAPATMILINTVVGGVACARLLGSVLVQPWRKKAVYGIMAAYIVTLIFIATGLPSPLYRLYVFTVSIIALSVCMKWLKESVKQNEAVCYHWLIRTVALLYVIILIAEFFGKAGAAAYLFKSSLMTMATIVPIMLFVHLIRGGVHWIYYSSPVWQIKLMRNDAEKYVRKTGFMLVAAILLFVLLPAVFMAWNLFDSIPKAITGLLTPGFYIGELRISVGLVIAASVTLYGSFFASQVLPKVLLDEAVTGGHMERGVRLSVGRLLQYLIISIGVLVAFSMLGLDLTKLTIVLSAFGVGIGFGLQSIVNNFVSGLILLFERPLREGDTINIGTNMAQIKKIGLRATIVQTFDNADVIIPNADLISNQVTNWTLNNRNVRVSLPVGVAYGSDVPLVGETLLACAKEHDAVAKSPAPHVLFMGLGDSSLDFELRVWIPDADDRILVRSELYHKIIQKFSDEKIVIPFPQRDLHLFTNEPISEKVLPKTREELEPGQVQT
ncbi:MAG: mechanosensitive ion channel [Desulfuromusa sp.]|nr:mechanosensitive ion channel [Desulfuromusa sp.]